MGLSESRVKVRGKRQGARGKKQRAKGKFWPSGYFCLLPFALCPLPFAFYLPTITFNTLPPTRTAYIPAGNVCTWTVV